jgi:hypothetical protein
VRPLPDCPACDAAGTLQPVRAEPRGVIVAACVCCARRCRVNAAGAIVDHCDPSAREDDRGSLLQNALSGD